MNLNFIKKLLLSIAEGVAKDGLIELIERAEVKHPTKVQAFINGVEELLPALKEMSEDTTTKVDDEVVRFLDELIQALEENDPPAQTDETDPHTPPPPPPPPHNP